MITVHRPSSVVTLQRASGTTGVQVVSRLVGADRQPPATGVGDDGAEVGGQLAPPRFVDPLPVTPGARDDHHVRERRSHSVQSPTPSP